MVLDVWMCRYPSAKLPVGPKTTDNDKTKIKKTVRQRKDFKDIYLPQGRRVPRHTFGPTLPFLAVVVQCVSRNFATQCFALRPDTTMAFMRMALRATVFAMSMFLVFPLHHHGNKPLPLATQTRPTFTHAADVYAVWDGAMSWLIPKASTGGPEDLYEVQEYVYNMLEAAAAVGNNTILETIATIILASLPCRQQVSNYTFDLGGSYVSFPLDPPVKMWRATDSVTNISQESLLDSAQWISLFARAARLMAAVPVANRGPNVTALLSAAPQVVVRDHVLRWAHPTGGDQEGVFAVHAWGCGWPQNLSAMRFTHMEFNALRYNRSFLPVGSPPANVSYCNAVTDADVWMITAAVNMLLAAQQDPVAVVLDAKITQILKEYTAAGVALINSRVAAHQ